MESIKIIIADAQYLIRLGLKCLLNKHERVSVIADVKDSFELSKAIDQMTPDIIIFDYDNEKNFCLSDISSIRQNYPAINFVIISNDNTKDNIYAVLEHEGISFLTKQCDEEEIMGAIYASAKKERFLCNKIVNVILEKEADEEDCLPTDLTNRELQILKLTAQGLSAKQIADQLFLSTHTIYTHKKNMMRKLKLNSSSELIVYAINNGIIKEEISSTT